MSLSDIMGHADLAIYAEVALVVFLLVFIAVVVRLLQPSHRQELDEASRLPLDDERTTPTRSATPDGED